jgi:hypothetical protein
MAYRGFRDLRFYALAENAPAPSGGTHRGFSTIRIVDALLTLLTQLRICLQARLKGHSSSGLVCSQPASPERVANNSRAPCLSAPALG